MKKILCLIDTLEMGGGAERQMAGLAGMLRQKGVDVTLATYHQHNSNDQLQGKYGIRSVLLETKNSKWSKIWAVRSFIKEGRFDTVIAYKDGPTMIGCMLRMLGMKYRLIVSERNTTQFLTRHERLKFFLYRWADVIVPNSVTQGSIICQDYPHLAKKTIVITNFTDTDYFKPLSLNCHEEAPLHILITGRIAEQKNVMGFMRVAKKLQERKMPVRISWYGSVYVGQEAYGEACRKLYKKLGMGDILTFLPATLGILDAYQHCDIFCLPSLYEGYPNVLCEAMSCGKPIVCSNVCDNPSIVEDGVNGFLFDPHNEDDMLEKIESMLSLPAKQREQMGRKSRETAERKFAPETFVNKYMEIIGS